MNLLTRIVSGDGIRKTRLHNYKGERIDLGGLLYLGHSIWSATTRKLFGSHGEIPWIGWRAIRRLDNLIQPDWKVLEFGSGMSTIWLANRAAQVVSIEHNPSWHATMAMRLADRGLSQVTYLKRGDSDYASLADFSNASFDFVLIDGIHRADCVSAVLEKLKPGGYVYLDNSDVHWDDYAEAERRIREAVAQRGGEITLFTDFFPGSIAVSQGLLARLR